jgi:hypothetical protein
MTGVNQMTWVLPARSRCGRDAQRWMHLEVFLHRKNWLDFSTDIETVALSPYLSTMALGISLPGDSRC